MAAAEAHRVAELIAKLDTLGVPRGDGAPKVRAALRDAGERYGNGVIAAAIRARKSLAATTTDDDEDAFEVVQF